MANEAFAFQQALLACDHEQARAVMIAALKDLEPLRFIEEVVVSALDQIGSGWEKGEYALSQVYMSGRICEDLVDSLLPPQSDQRKNQPKIAIALLNDYHGLGKRIVYSALRASGYSLVDYGRVDQEELVRRIRGEKIELLMISVLMYTSALQVEEVIKNLSFHGHRVKIAVGGAPFRLDRDLWRQVGAHAVGYSAFDALKIAATMREERQ